MSTKVVASANMTITYPEEILIERGWMEYANLIVNNSGDNDLHNLTVSAEGYYNWFEFQKNTTPVIIVNNETEFITKIYVPVDISVGSYNFSLKLTSNEISTRKNFVIRVFETEDDLLLYQINSLRNDLSGLEGQAKKTEDAGNDMTFAKDALSQIKTKLDLAEEQITNKMYNNATENIRDIEKLFIEAKFDISNPHKSGETLGSINVSAKDVVFYSSGIGIILLIATLIYLVKRVKIQNKIRIPNLKVKEVVVDDKRIKEMEQEIEKTKESQVIIENEFKENMISKGSYDELKMKYQQKVLELESEIKKLRGY